MKPFVLITAILFGVIGTAAFLAGMKAAFFDNDGPGAAIGILVGELFLAAFGLGFYCLLVNP